MTTQSTKLNSKTIKCTVVSDKMNKSRVGLIERRVKHPKVGKYIKKSTKIMFHDELNSTKEGDIVLVQETKPFSKRKAFVLSQVVRQSEDKGLVI